MIKVGGRRADNQRLDDKLHLPAAELTLLAVLIFRSDVDVGLDHDFLVVSDAVSGCKCKMMLSADRWVK